MSATNYLSDLPVRPEWQLLIGGPFRAARRWVDGAPTQEPQLGEHQLPVWRSNATLTAEGIDQAPVTLEVEAQAEPDRLPTALVKVPVSTRLSVRGPAKGQYGLSLTLTVDAAGFAALRGQQPSTKAA